MAPCCIRSWDLETSGNSDHRQREQIRRLFVVAGVLEPEGESRDPFELHSVLVELAEWIDEHPQAVAVRVLRQDRETLVVFWKLCLDGVDVVGPFSFSGGEALPRQRPPRGP
jgi:hypothetical protein